VGGVADLGEWNPEGPLGPEALTDLLGAVIFLSRLPRMANGYFSIIFTYLLKIIFQ
jgi:hypothetical protein